MKNNDMFSYLNIGLPEDILRHKMHGDFDTAIRLIDLRLQRKDLTKALRACLTVQREIICRTEKDYPFSRADALALLRQNIPDFTDEEFDTMVDNGEIGWIYVRGEVRYFNRFFGTLCKVNANIARRAGVLTASAESAKKGSKAEGLLDCSMRLMKEQGSLAKRFHIRASLKVKDEAFTPGMFIRAHLPIPAACEQQSEIVIEKIYPETGMVAPEDALQRTICWEETMEENHEFYVEYSYVHKAVYHDLERCVSDMEQPTFDTEELAPHVVFTPYIRSLVEELTEGVTDPLEKARRFYDFITLNMKYNFMPAYFCLENIAETCARNYSGDCGVFALLFLTLCRCAGIPAQWQSGFAAEPNFCGAHDWIRFYVAPYGWLYADLSYGIGAVRTDSEERRKFYFGNLDPYRMVANRAFQAPFDVDKQHWRADPYDNQVGEMETADRGLTYDEYDRDKAVLSCEDC